MGVRKTTKDGMGGQGAKSKIRFAENMVGLDDLVRREDGQKILKTWFA